MKNKCWKILSAITSRLFFSLHGFSMVLVAIYLTGSLLCLLLLTGIILLFVEMIVTLKATKKGEWKWFSPMVFLYLSCIIPSVFVMELSLLENRISLINETNSECINNDYKEYSNEMQAMEELTILVLVVGRWLMPKGHMSRDQLSQLLLTYLALGADILDILQLIKEPAVNTNWTVTIVGLCLFSWAIFQFTIVLTQTVDSTPSRNTTGDEELQSSTTINNRPYLILCSSTEVWSVVVTVGMQDGPFLVYRIYLATAKGVFNDSMTFFICKNILTVLIEIYRIVLYLCQERRERKKFQQTHIAIQS